MKTFASLKQPDKIAYSVLDSWDSVWNARGTAPLSLYLVQFDTYGDGLCQHGPERCVQWASLADACASLATAILAEPTAPEWGKVSSSIRTATDATIRFCFTVGYREDKPQWVNWNEGKVSTSPSRRHDKRWDEVPSWANKDAKTAYGLIAMRDDGMDWFDRAFLALRCRQLFYEHTNYWQDRYEILPAFRQLPGCAESDANSEALPTFQAVEALQHALTVVRNIDLAKGQLSCALSNMGIGREQAA